MRSRECPRPSAIRPLIATLLALFLLTPPVTAQQSGGRTYYWHPSLSLTNTDTIKLADWLKWLGIPVPFSISGKVTVALTGGVPLNRPHTPAAYQLDGSIDSTSLVVNGIAIENLHADIRYRNGVMRLTGLRFQLPRQPNEVLSPGLSGTATVPLVPLGDVAMNAEFNNLRWSRIADWLGIAKPVDGIVSGKADVSIAAADFRNPEAWRGTASLASRDFAVDELTMPSADLLLQFAQARVSVEHLRGVINDVPVAITGNVELSEDRRSISLNPMRVEGLGGNLTVRGLYPIVEPSPQPFEIMLRDCDLAQVEQVARRLAARLVKASWPETVEGKINASANVVVPFPNLMLLNQYRVQAAVESPQIIAGEIGAEGLSASIAFDGRRLRIDPLQWQWPDHEASMVSGTVDISLGLTGSLQTSLRADRLPANVVSQVTGVSFAGSADATIEAAAPTLALSNPLAWLTKLELTGRDFRLAGLPARIEVFNGAWQGNTLTLNDCRIAWNSEPMRLAGRVSLAEDHTSVSADGLKIVGAGIDATVTARWPVVPERDGTVTATWDRLDFAWLGKAMGPEPIPLSGTTSGKISVALGREQPEIGRPIAASLQLAGDLAGTAELAVASRRWRNPASWSGSMKLSMERLTVDTRLFEDLSIDATLADSELHANRLQALVNGVEFSASGSARWQRDPQAIVLAAWSLELLGGAATVDGIYPLTSVSPGQADVQWEGIDLAALRNVVGPDLPVLAGQLEGSMELKAAPSQGGERPLTIAGVVKSEQLQMGGVRFQQLDGAVKTDNGVAFYQASAGTLGGFVSIEGTEVLDRDAIGPDGLQSKGQFSLQGTRLPLIADAIVGQRTNATVFGTGNLIIAFERRRDEPMRGSGRLELTGLDVGRMSISRRLQANVAYQDGVFELRELGGDIFSGSATAMVRTDLAQFGAGTQFDLTIRRAQVAALAEAMGAETPFEGRVNLQLRGRIDSQLRAAGQISGDRLTSGSVQIDTWRSPIDLAVELEHGAGYVKLSQIGAQLSLGRLTGHVQYRWGTNSSLDAKVNAVGLDLRSLLRFSPTLANYAQGRVTGEVLLAAKPFRDVNDLAGRINARLESVQPGRTPVFDRVLPVVAGAGANSLVFSDGSVQATLGRGVVQIQRLSLTSPQVRVFSDGAVRINGALDLNVTAYTGGTPLIAREFGILSQLELVNPPLALVTRINRAMSNRVISASVTGTVSSPIVQLRPLPMLTNEALRFFLGSDLLPAEAAYFR